MHHAHGFLKMRFQNPYFRVLTASVSPIGHLAASIVVFLTPFTGGVS